MNRKALLSAALVDLLDVNQSRHLHKSNQAAWPWGDLQDKVSISILTLWELIWINKSYHDEILDHANLSK